MTVEWLPAFIAVIVAGFPFHVVGDEEIDVAVVVIVESRHSTQHDFWLIVVAGCAIFQGKVETGAGCDILELNGRGDRETWYGYPTGRRRTRRDGAAEKRLVLGVQLVI